MPLSLHLSFTAPLDPRSSFDNQEGKAPIAQALLKVLPVKVRPSLASPGRLLAMALPLPLHLRSVLPEAAEQATSSLLSLRTSLANQEGIPSVAQGFLGRSVPGGLLIASASPGGPRKLPSVGWCSKS